MCSGCGALKGKALDVYAAALTLPANQRLKFVESQDPGRRLGLIVKLGPMLDEHKFDPPHR